MESLYHYDVRIGRCKEDWAGLDWNGLERYGICDIPSMFVFNEPTVSLELDLEVHGDFCGIVWLGWDAMEYIIARW